MDRQSFTAAHGIVCGSPHALRLRVPIPDLGLNENDLLMVGASGSVTGLIRRFSEEETARVQAHLRRELEQVLPPGRGGRQHLGVIGDGPLDAVEGVEDD